MTHANPTDSAAMTAAEFRVAIEALGIDQGTAAELLGVTDRTVRRWIAGTHDIPAGAAADVRKIEAHTDDFVDAVVEQLIEGEPDEDGQRWVLTHASDAAYRTLHPDAHLPASWHRAAMGRVAREVHGVRLHYPTQEDV